MVKAEVKTPIKGEVKTPNKRKSIASNTPAKKVKVENGNGKSPTKPFAPKKEAQSPKGDLKLTNKQSKPEKTVKPFAGTKQINQAKKGQQPKNAGPPTEGKKKRKNMFANLIAQVKTKEGSNDPELLKILNTRIEAIVVRNELTKTAKKKLAMLNKLKVICTEGSEAASKQTKANIAEVKKIADQKKADKKLQPQVGKKDNAGKKKASVKASTSSLTGVKEEDDDDDEDDDDEDEDDDDEEAVDSEGEEEEDSDDEAEAEVDEEEDDDDDSDAEDEIPVPAPKVSLKKSRPNKKK